MKRRLLILLSALIILASSCGVSIITDPMPILGNYLVKSGVSSNGYIYCFSIRDDGTFTFIQRGGASTTETFIFEGTWSASLNHFDFYHASGTITFTPTKPEAVNYESLVFTIGRDNVFTFQWVLDSGSVNTTFSLSAENEAVSMDIGMAQNISSAEFDEKLQDALDKINGIEEEPSEGDEGNVPEEDDEGQTAGEENPPEDSSGDTTEGDIAS